MTDNEQAAAAVAECRIRVLKNLQLVTDTTELETGFASFSGILSAAMQENDNTVVELQVYTPQKNTFTKIIKTSGELDAQGKPL